MNRRTTSGNKCAKRLCFENKGLRVGTSGLRKYVFACMQKLYKFDYEEIDWFIYWIFKVSPVFTVDRDMADVKYKKGIYYNCKSLW